VQQIFNNMRRRGDDDRGFTMIELLVVVVIIGVLVAIAVPVYLNYRRGAANKSAASDLRGAITAIEQFYTDNSNQYPPNETGTEGVNIPLEAIVGAGGAGTAGVVTVSPGNIVQIASDNSANPAWYHICAQNSDGEDIYVYSSTAGGAV
jgi:type IV pilus assembly protein PilA